MEIKGYRKRKAAGKTEIRSMGETALVFQQNFSPIDGTQLPDSFAQINLAGLKNDLVNADAQLADMKETRDDLAQLVADIEAAMSKKAK